MTLKLKNMGTEATRLNSGIQGFIENYLEFRA